MSISIHYKWHSHHRSPFDCIIYIWTFLDWTPCDRYFYPTSECVTWPPSTTKLQHPISNYYPILRNYSISVGYLNFHIIFHQRCPIRRHSTCGPSLYNGWCSSNLWSSNLLFHATPIIFFTIHTSIFWRALKSLVEPTWGFNYVELRKVGTWGPFSTSSTKRGRGAC